MVGVDFLTGGFIDDGVLMVENEPSQTVHKQLGLGSVKGHSCLFIYKQVKLKP